MSKVVNKLTWLWNVEFFIDGVGGSHVVVKGVQPIESPGKERDGGKGRVRYWQDAARDLRSRKHEASPRFLGPAGLRRLQLRRAARQCRRQLPEFPLEDFSDMKGLSVMPGTSVIASGFPIPEAFIVLARLARVAAAVRPPAPVHAGVDAGRTPPCTLQSRLCLPPGRRACLWPVHRRVSAAA